MTTRLTVVYELDEDEISLERIFDDVQPPAYLKAGDTILLSYGEGAASFRVVGFDWQMPENEVTVDLDPCIKPENGNEFWSLVKAFLSHDWKVVDGNTAFVTLDALKNKGYTDKIIA